MRRIFRNSVIFVLSICCISYAAAMSKGPIRIALKRINGKPVACIPADDNGGGQSVRLYVAGISRATGPTTPAVIYWGIKASDDEQPVYLKRGECIVYGQTMPGMTLKTPPRSFDVDKWYNFSVITSDEHGTTIYRGGFCVRPTPDGGGRVVLPEEDQDPCPSGK
ncbi:MULTISPECIES: hypothetical protein [Burkholderia]|uniref:hypothetical protein n=1 Tax=Burkholderia TaxID=32008 RepID=UPI00075B0582|nr:MULTISPECIES: hypothetical protein [Burkholderia]AOJ69121.1 hypothetical protein WS78_10415 [Burkholderia savannae]KVG39438.1 hypothetical protein WS77_19705 [Burkholderia sp. MSMB0265]KVG80363.1 hypothetical protein WS81_13610 [Burkholderia sp. MSMB2040]KVG93264.1 hypothetical protein WS83_01155 [Burkholderia sp. MSMB2042]KVG98100.1 hypothetical protein WS82_00870 [Burkholderia sp. MSMB2041]